MCTPTTKTGPLSTLLEISHFSKSSAYVTLFLFLVLFRLSSLNQNDQFNRVKPSTSGSRRQLVKVLTRSLLCRRNFSSNSSHYVEGTISTYCPLLASYAVAHSRVDGTVPRSLKVSPLLVSLLFGREWLSPRTSRGRCFWGKCLMSHSRSRATF